MKPSTPSTPNNNLFVKALNHFYYQDVKSIPVRGRHFADRLNAQARNTNNLASKTVQKTTAKITSLVTDSVEFAKFEKTPELFGATIPKLPLTFLILMFFGSMMPARMHSEYLRAPALDENKDGIAKGHDYRAIRDVLIRDVLSISLFLFALEPVKQAMLAKKQKDGTLFSLGYSPKHSSLMLMDGSLNPRKPHHSISYPNIEEIYNLTSQAPETLAKLAAMHKANDNLAKPMEDYLQAYPLWHEESTSFLKVLQDPHSTPEEQAKARFMLQFSDALKTKGRSLLAHTEELRSAKTHLRTHLYEALIGLPAEAGATTMRRQTLNADSHTLIRRLFELPGLEKMDAVQQLDSRGLKAILEGDLHALGEKIKVQALVNLPDAQSYLAPATRSADYARFKAHVDLAMKQGDIGAFHLMADKAMNYQHFIDVCTRQVLSSHRTSSEGKPLSYSHVFNTLKNEHFAQLEESIASYRAGQNLLDALKSEHGEGILTHFKAMYTHSANAMKQVDALDATVKQLQHQGAGYLKTSFNFLGTQIPLPAVDWIKKQFKLQTLQSLDVRRILSESARNMRSPVDSIGYVLVAAFIGFFPVWLNQVVTETEYRLKKAKDALPRREASL
jgi:hypothetical protein